MNRSKKDNNKKSANFGYVGREAINTKTNLLHQLIWHLKGVRTKGGMNWLQALKTNSFGLPPGSSLCGNDFG